MLLSPLPRPIGESQQQITDMLAVLVAQAIDELIECLPHPVREI